MNRVKEEIHKLKKGLLKIIRQEKDDRDKQELSKNILEQAYNINRIHDESYSNVLAGVLKSKEFPDLPFLENGLKAQDESPDSPTLFDMNEYIQNRGPIKNITQLDECNQTQTQMNNSVELRERFRVMCILGAGGCGQVYHALDITTGKQVIIKSNLSNGQCNTISTIHNEIQILQTLKRLNACDYLFVPCYIDEFTDSDETQYLITEAFIDGKTNLPAQDLKQHLKKSLDQFNVYDRLKVYLTILQVAKYLNDIGIKHKDLKPANILVNSTFDKIQIIDFGVACYVNLAPCKKGFTKYYQPDGYHQPKFEDIDDLYSLVVILGDMFKPKRKFSTNNTPAIDFARYLTPTFDSISTFAKLLLQDCRKSQSCNNKIDLNTLIDIFQKLQLTQPTLLRNSKRWNST